MIPEQDPQNDKSNERNNVDSTRQSGQEGEKELLEQVILDAMDPEAGAAYRLISRVARQSDYSDTTDLRAIEQLVRAIVDERFGKDRIGKSLVRKVASSLIESPEATIRLERLWQEARNDR